MKINWISEILPFPPVDIDRAGTWLVEVARRHGFAVRRLNYIFVDDPEILRINVSALGHDYFTDIITFDYSAGDSVAGDMYISLDTVRTNAKQLGADYLTELHRVIVHGLLHLCGINDKGQGEREIMERHEDEALAILREMTREP